MKEELKTYFEPDVIFTENYVSDIKEIILQSRQYVKNHINYAMIYAYWLIGKRIVLQEQKGEIRAEYGKEIIKNLSEELTKEFGKGFSPQSLYNFRMFFERFTEPEKFSAVWRILTWSHYKLIMRVTQKEARDWYCNESSAQNWDTRTLERNIGTKYYERLLSSQVKEPVIKEMEKGFAFVERQKLVRTETEDFYIDLVFYNFILKCFVLVDLKMNTLTHRDVGQMDFYVRMFDDIYKKEDDNPTIGILLCSETDKTVAKYSVLKESKQIFASKYLTLLPTEKELEEEIERQKEIFAETHNTIDGVQK